MNINSTHFDFTSAWPTKMQTAVCQQLAKGLMQAVDDFCLEEKSSPMAAALMAIAVSKEFDNNNLVKLGYPFTESFARTLASSVRGVEAALIKSWEETPGGVENFAFTQGYAEMAKFLERNQTEAQECLQNCVNLIVEHTLKESPHG